MVARLLRLALGRRVTIAPSGRRATDAATPHAATPHAALEKFGADLRSGPARQLWTKTLAALPPGNERMTIGPLDHCGVWSIFEDSGAAAVAQPKSNDAPPATPVLEIACNLASASESDVRPPEELLAATKTVSPVLAGFGSRPVWFWLLLTGLVLTTVEWVMYQRRVIS